MFSEDKRIAVLDFFLTGAFNELPILLIKGIIFIETNINKIKGNK